MKLSACFLFIIGIGLCNGQSTVPTQTLELTPAQVKASGLPVTGWCNPGEKHEKTTPHDRLVACVQNGVNRDLCSKNKVEEDCVCHQASGNPISGTKIVSCNLVLFINGHRAQKPRPTPKPEGLTPCRQGGWSKPVGTDDSHCRPDATPKKGQPGSLPWN